MNRAGKKTEIKLHIGTGKPDVDIAIRSICRDTRTHTEIIPFHGEKGNMRKAMRNNEG